MFDDVALTLFYITMLVLFTRWLSFRGNKLLLLSTIFWSLFVCSTAVFSTSSLLVLYVFYEASLVPIRYTILKWGVYPDRGVRALSILIFTRVFTFPLSLLIISGFLSLGSFSFFRYSFRGPWEDLNLMLSLWILLRFAVKLPIYGLHYWLPLAHVEAPTFGSMVLAGLLLKIGGCGLLRLIPLYPSFLSSWASVSMIYIVFAVLISRLMCCVQSDFKRLVAYSSVVHISFICLLFCTITTLSYKTALMLMVFHGLRSPVLFCFVGAVYQLFISRQLILTRGLLTISPVCSFISLLIFLSNVPVPPSPGFLSEALLFTATFTLSYWVLLLLVISLFISMVYRVVWYSTISFRTHSNYSNTITPPSPLLLATISSLVFSSFAFVGFIFLF